jgi:putative nucleotidyltransferase with HDIG domain
MHDPNQRRSTPLRTSWAALGGATLTGVAWAVDARRRERKADQVHRILVDLLLNALHSGDPVTERHSRRVAALTDSLSRSYRLGEAARARLRIAALLHDLGKIDDQLFDLVHGCDPLTPEEREKMQGHPGEAAEILGPLELLHPGITSVVRAHHECWDGSGYPSGLRGEEIPLDARLLSAADVFDALTQRRSYREPIPVAEALEKIGESAGRKFDPEVIRRLAEPEVRARWMAIAARGREEERRAAEESRADELAASG